MIDRLLDDGLSVNRLQLAMHRDFLLDLSAGFLSDCLDWKVRQTDLPAYRRWTRANFSDTLCVDELHLGHRVLLLATDPLGDFPVAFALVSANDQDHMRRFLNILKTHGFSPQVVVTDGSKLYPADLWPDARHQLCVFHVLKDINGHVFDALRRHAATGGRNRRRGGLPRSPARRNPMKPLVREEVQELEELLRVIGPLSEQELRTMVGVLARAAARSPFEVAMLTVQVDDGRPDMTVSVGGERSDER